MSRPKPPSPLSEGLQRAIAASGMSLNQIGKAAGVSQAQLSRFVRGDRTLTLPVADRLCGLFGLALTRAAGADAGSVLRGGGDS